MTTVFLKVKLLFGGQGAPKAPMRRPKEPSGPAADSSGPAAEVGCPAAEVGGPAAEVGGHAVEVGGHVGRGADGKQAASRRGYKAEEKEEEEKDQDMRVAAMPLCNQRPGRSV